MVESCNNEFLKFDLEFNKVSFSLLFKFIPSITYAILDISMNTAYKLISVFFYDR